jgi:hypothetical protein
MFPYSSTPYIVVQWDPAFGHQDELNLYFVLPGPGGIVTASSFVPNLVGNLTGAVPNASDRISMNVTFDITTRYLAVDVTDATSATPLVRSHETVPVATVDLDFTNGTRYYFGAGASGNGVNSWGLLYLSLTPITSPSTSTPSSSSGSLIPIDDLIYGLLGGLVAAAVVLLVILNRQK